MKEHYYDKLLNIKTQGDLMAVSEQKTLHYHPYEPTPYSALEVLFESYQLKPSDRAVDFGCGKGRLNFYLHYFFRAAVVGIEMNETLYQAAIGNRETYRKKTKTSQDKINFHCCLAEEYEIDPLDNRFYFFNPFSVQIFRRIINNVLESLEAAERDVELILYYPSEDYIYYLENDTLFELKQEITIPHDYPRDSNERFLIYRVSGTM